MALLRGWAGFPVLAPLRGSVVDLEGSPWVQSTDAVRLVADSRELLEAVFSAFCNTILRVLLDFT